MHMRALYELAIARAIRDLREHKGVPREEIAEALGVEEQEVTRFELAAEPLTAGSLLVLLDLFTMSFAEFEAVVGKHLDEARADMA